MLMSNHDDHKHVFARWRNSEVSRNFHRLGLLVGAMTLGAGLLLMAKDALGIRFWDLIPADIPILAGGDRYRPYRHRIGFIGHIRHRPCDRLGD